MKKISLLALLLLFAGFVTGCTDIDDYYSRVDENGLTNEIKNIVPEDVLAEMQDLGFPVNGGEHPPIVDGSYFVSPFKLLHSNIPQDTPAHRFADYTFSFYNQNNFDLTVEMEYVNATGTNTGQGSNGFIVGTGNKFSAFFDVLSTDTDGNVAEMVVAISGTLVVGGIENFHFANFMVDDHGDPNNSLIANGQGRVIHDSDYFSEKVEGRLTHVPSKDEVDSSTFFDVNMEL